MSLLSRCRHADWYLVGLVVLQATGAWGADPPAETWTPAQILKYRQISDLALEPGGGRLAYVVSTPWMDGNWIAFLSSRGGKTANLWRIRVAGGEAEQLTEERGGISAFQWSPDGRSIAFLMPDPKTEAEERAERERDDALVVDDHPKFSRLYRLEV